VVDVHRQWGVEAVFQLPATTASQGQPTRYFSLWSPVAPDPAGPQSGYIARDDQSIIALGVTFPPGDEVPEDVRIWLVHAADQLEWIDARMVVGGIQSGTMLFVRSTVPGVTPSSWPGGHYRIDALVSGQVRRISVQIPSRLGSVAGPDPWPTTTTDLVAPTDSDLSQVHPGLFATANGVGVALGAMAGPSLSEAEAWLQIVGQAGRPGPRAVPTVYLPGATALGVMLPKGSSVRSALVRRLAPDPNFSTGLRFDGMSSSERPSPYTLFAPRGGGAIPPGDYGFEVRWTDDTGEHAATWHVELRPGPN
jgi:hypothetical protein